MERYLEGLKASVDVVGLEGFEVFGEKREERQLDPYFGGCAKLRKPTKHSNPG